MDLINNLYILMAAINKMAQILFYCFVIPSMTAIFVFRKDLAKIFR